MEKKLLGEIELNRIYQRDFFEGMKLIPDKSIDMVLCDLPYGVTARNKWDLPFSIDILWSQYKRVIKDTGAIVLFGQDKFTAKMMMAEPKLHRYNLIWDKRLPTGFLNANRMPLRSHEDIMVFYKKLPTYNPQKVKGEKNHSKGGKVGDVGGSNYNAVEAVDNSELLGDMKFPKSILSFDKVHPSIAVHPTQKPVELCEWLIKTYTNPGEIVLDNCMGSGTTAVAATRLARNFIGFETEPKYLEIANKRLESVVWGEGLTQESTQ